ncbi:MAG: DUF4428 domain-containing protein [Clostridia bacterium]|nr:DUF4428 domain-containing protein [Clostridia bacterium]
MGLFDKKNCDICGKQIGLLGNRKLDDGNLCKECAGKLSPWFSDRRRSTVADIKEQLAYREQNKLTVGAFRCTKKYGDGFKMLMVDENMKRFTVCGSNDLRTGNPDIVEMSKVTDCVFTIDEDKTEILKQDADGKESSYEPKRFECEYKFKVTILVAHKYFDDMYFDLTNSAIEKEHYEYKEDGSYTMTLNPNFDKYVQMGNEIVTRLTGREATVSAGETVMPEAGAEPDVQGEFTQNFTNPDKPIPYRYINKEVGLDLNLGLVLDCDLKFAVTDAEKYKVMSSNAGSAISSALNTSMTSAVLKVNENYNGLGLKSKKAEILEEVKKGLSLLVDVLGVTLTDMEINSASVTENDKVLLGKLGINLEAEAAKTGEWFCPNCGAKNSANFCMQCGTKRP